jgi:hypothetical protein
MSPPIPAALPEAQKPWWHPSLIAGPLLSFAAFAVGLLVLGWSPGLVLLGFWLEEVLQLVTCGVTSIAIERRRGGKGSYAGVLLPLFFPFLHLVFIVIFLFVDSSGNPATAALLEDLRDLIAGDLSYMSRETILSLLQIAGLAIAATSADAVRRRRAFRRDPVLAELELDTRMRQALALPHLTILAGGGVMMAMESNRGLAAGLVVGKAIVELLLFPAMRRSVLKEREKKAVPAAPPEAAPPTSST